jgi:ATP-dependent DNA helicase RecG
MGVRVKVIPALEANDAKYVYEATEDFVKVSVGKASGIILDACRENGSITIPELAILADITERSVQRNIRKLQESGLLRRIGGRKEGRWEVLV